MRQYFLAFACTSGTFANGFRKTFSPLTLHLAGFLLPSLSDAPGFSDHRPVAVCFFATNGALMPFLGRSSTLCSSSNRRSIFYERFFDATHRILPCFLYINRFRIQIGHKLSLAVSGQLTAIRSQKIVF